MRRKLKVYLQYPWKFPDSPYYKYLLFSPPKNIKYLNIDKQQGAITSPRKFWFLTRIKVNIRRLLNWLDLPIPNAHKTESSENYDLIHCAHCLSKNKSEPWVADMEGVWSMFISGFKNKTAIQRIRRILLRDNCKKILPWTKHAESKILEMFPEIRGKVELVYPAIPAKKKFIEKKEGIVIFIARDFKLKGGVIALKTMDKIKKDIPYIRCICISPVPRELREKYRNIEIYDLMSQDKLFDLMKKAKLFLYPSFMDTFGFTILEAMSFGLPVVALKTFLTDSVSEIIGDKQGVLINSNMTHRNLNKEGIEEVSEKLKEASIKILKDSHLHKEMSNNCIKEIESGKFSIGFRNKKLRKIYMGAIDENSKY